MLLRAGVEPATLIRDPIIYIYVCELAYILIILSLFTYWSPKLINKRSPLPIGYHNYYIIYIIVISSL
jgi:hypothetical protein